MTTEILRSACCGHRLSSTWDSFYGWHYECARGCECCISSHPDPAAAKAQADR